MKRFGPEIRLALIYTILGVIWIFLSDQVLSILFFDNEIIHYKVFQTLKGVLFVFFTGVLLYVISMENYRRLTGKIKELRVLSFSLSNRNKMIELKNSELESSEKRFQDLFSLSPQPMFVYCIKELKFLAVNKAMIDKYHFTHEEFMNMKILDIIPREKWEMTIQLIEDLKSNNLILKENIQEHQNKTCNKFTVNIKSNYLQYNGVDARIVLLNDVTELVETQNSLKVAYDTIVRIEEDERERFASELHDTIAQNLVVIKQLNEMVRPPENSENTSKYYSILSETIENALVDCRQIIYNIRPKELHDEGLKNSINSLFLRNGPVRGMKMKLDFDTEIDKILDFDTQFQLYRIFQENFYNTIKHASANEIIISLKLEGKQLVYSYEDNGIGISPEKLNKESNFLSLKRRVVILKSSLIVEPIVSGGIRFKFNFSLGLRK